MMAAGDDLKGIVFSQWTSMLDLVASHLTEHGIGFLRLDGAMSQAQRASVLEAFGRDPQARVFLLTMRTGGVGLNLTTASRVFLLVRRGMWGVMRHAFLLTVYAGSVVEPASRGAGYRPGTLR